MAEWKIPIVIALSIISYYAYDKTKISEDVVKFIPKSNLEEKLSGIPLSVETIGDAYGAGFSTIIDTGEGKYILCNANRIRKEARYTILTEAAALIESEMNDGDFEPIDVKGYWEGNRFNINNVSANGYSLHLR